MKTTSLYTIMLFSGIMASCHNTSRSDHGAESDIHTNTSSTSDMHNQEAEKQQDSGSNSENSATPGGHTDH